MARAKTPKDEEVRKKKISAAMRRRFANQKAAQAATKVRMRTPAKRIRKRAGSKKPARTTRKDFSYKPPRKLRLREGQTVVISGGRAAKPADKRALAFASLLKSAAVRKVFRAILKAVEPVPHKPRRKK